VFRLIFILMRSCRSFCSDQGLNVSVAGVPKTIDNDIDYIDQSFGFSSAVEAAQLAIRTAKTEAVCNKPNGIGIVKLMGRSAGFIAAHSTMSSSDVDLCLVPEVPIVLEGPKGCLPHLRRRVREQGYAVVVVAEGAGEELLGESAEVDAGGNKKLPPIGEYMKMAITDYYKKHGEEATVKYIDPSYMVRSVPANAADSLCKSLLVNQSKNLRDGDFLQLVSRFTLQIACS
jgi:6-phosphofructokinase 1